MERMSIHERTRRTALAINGAAKLCTRLTSSLLTTPAPVATRPLMTVALPIIWERSDWETLLVVAEEMSQESKTEKRMEVEIPPRTRPRRRMGTHGMRMHRHDKAYVMQKVRQRNRRPLRNRQVMMMMHQ